MHLSEKIVCAPFCWRLKLGLILIILHELSTSLRNQARMSFHELNFNTRHEEQVRARGFVWE